jgi:hypothetical protein
VVAAELLGWEDAVGALAPGRYADAIAVPGDPLADLGLLTDVPFVMQGGRILKDDRSPITQGGRILKDDRSPITGGGRILKWEGPDAPLSGGGPYSPE